MKKYFVNWDNGNEACGQIGPFPTVGAATCCAYDVLEGWLEAARMDGYDADTWNYMIYNASVSIDEYDTKTDTYEPYWEPTDDELSLIGWIEMEEEEQ